MLCYLSGLLCLRSSLTFTLTVQFFLSYPWPWPFWKGFENRNSALGRALVFPLQEFPPQALCALPSSLCLASPQSVQRSRKAGSRAAVCFSHLRGWLFYTWHLLLTAWWCPGVHFSCLVIICLYWCKDTVFPQYSSKKIISFPSLPCPPSILFPPSLNFCLCVILIYSLLNGFICREPQLWTRQKC